ncbi:hypothetical protein C2845_PM13G08580 [Panicum miliaceum]|uniref:Uncharacterized protein n=1 Tax=Panicum miliaceum TaxID=4540 RepID=A0A3L6RL09_PANMI|nr:hypothetical protein C2845_PM13G08580 [Panicum miliaceum]
MPPSSFPLCSAPSPACFAFESIESDLGDAAISPHHGSIPPRPRAGSTGATPKEQKREGQPVRRQWPGSKWEGGRLFSAVALASAPRSPTRLHHALRGPFPALPFPSPDPHLTQCWVQPVCCSNQLPSHLLSSPNPQRRADWHPDERVGPQRRGASVVAVRGAACGGTEARGAVRGAAAARRTSSSGAWSGARSSDDMEQSARSLFLLFLLFFFMTGATLPVVEPAVMFGPSPSGLEPAVMAVPITVELNSTPPKLVVMAILNQR